MPRKSRIAPPRGFVNTPVDNLRTVKRAENPAPVGARSARGARKRGARNATHAAGGEATRKCPVPPGAPSGGGRAGGGRGEPTDTDSTAGEAQQEKPPGAAKRQTSGRRPRKGAGPQPGDRGPRGRSGSAGEPRRGGTGRPPEEGGRRAAAERATEERGARDRARREGAAADGEAAERQRGPRRGAKRYPAKDGAAPPKPTGGRSPGGRRGRASGRAAPTGPQARSAQKGAGTGRGAARGPEARPEQARTPLGYGRSPCGTGGALCPGARAAHLQQRAIDGPRGLRRSLVCRGQSRRRLHGPLGP